ncbi:MAG: caspase family protein [Devosia sp.]
MRRMLALAPICFLGAMIASGAAQAENYALIVAATKYPNLAEKFWLKGPANDAILVHDYLVNNAPQPFAEKNVTTLATADGLADPTKANILGALDKIAAEAKAGDFVYLHFSGHGTYQPAIDDPTEPDGRDEVFLASDVRMAEPGGKFMPNAVTDNELGAAITKIRETGAFVWAIFDNCHSGTVTRAAMEEGDVVERKIEPADLGIPDSAFPEARDDETAQRVAPVGDAEEAQDKPRGGLVAFFAAQSTETTPERNFPVLQPDGSSKEVKYGVFSYTIFSALAKSPAATYRELAQAVLQEYAARNTLKPSPLFEGDLDAPVFGSEAVASKLQWATALDTGDGSIGISAGQLHGLSSGTKLLLLANPSDEDDKAIGLMEVSATGPLRSIIVPASDDTHPLIKAAEVPKGAYVRLAERTYDFELTVARPDPSSGSPEDVAQVNAALDSILAQTEQQDRELPLRLKLVEPKSDADLRLGVYTEGAVAELSGDPEQEAAVRDAAPALWLMPTSGEISLTEATRTPALALDDTAFEEELTKNLVTVFRATGLSRLGQASTYKPNAFKLGLGLQKMGSDRVEALDIENTPIVQQGDWLHIDLANESKKPMDLNVLYIDHDYGITQVCRVHLAAGDNLFAPIAGLNQTDMGAERIVVVLNENSKEVTTDLSYLQQAAITRTRDAGDDTIMGMITDLGAGDATRGPTTVATKASTAPRAAVILIPLEVQAAGPDYVAPQAKPAAFVDDRQGRDSCWDE